MVTRSARRLIPQVALAAAPLPSTVGCGSDDEGPTGPTGTVGTVAFNVAGTVAGRYAVTGTHRDGLEMGTGAAASLAPPA